MKTSIKQSLKSGVKGLMPALLAAASLMLSGAAPVLADNNGHDSRDRNQQGDQAWIVRPDERYQGKTYGQWAAAWWQWVYSIPIDQNPVTDPTGAFSQVGQNGPVFFLAGNFGGSTVRECTVPAGKGLFFPLLNQSWVQFPGDPPYTIDELRAIIAPSVDNPILSCEIDGKAVRHPQDYREQSAVFSVTVPAGNLLGLTPGTYAPCVDDGYYLMLEPLEAGRHTIHFAAQNHDGAFSLDVTYHIQVAAPVKIARPDERFHGKTHAEWSAAFWKWTLEYPLQGHPAIDDPSFDFSARQSGDVWFWAAPDGPLTRTVTIPAGKALFLSMRDVETSTLEEFPFFGATEAAQRSNSTWFADHIVNMFCIIDGVAVENLEAYRVVSPQFRFTAPTPWIFGTPGANIGGRGKAVGDGYYLIFSSLPEGTHTIHYGGTFRFAAGELGDDAFDLPKDITIQLTVGKERHNEH
jgi:hypothetical protein